MGGGTRCGWRRRTSGAQEPMHAICRLGRRTAQCPPPRRALRLLRRRRLLLPAAEFLRVLLLPELLRLLRPSVLLLRSSSIPSSSWSSFRSSSTVRWCVVSMRRSGRVAAAVVAAGDHDHRDQQADDHRDQAGDQQPHVAVRAASTGAVASGPRSSGPIRRVGSSCIVFLTPPVRGSRRGSRRCPRSRNRFAVAARSPPGCCRRRPSASPAGGLRRRLGAWPPSGSGRAPACAPRWSTAPQARGSLRSSHRLGLGGRHRPAAAPSTRAFAASSVACRLLGLLAQGQSLPEQRVDQLGKIGGAAARRAGRPRRGPAPGSCRACASASSITLSAARSAASTIASSRSRGVGSQVALLLGDVAGVAAAAHRADKPRRDSPIRPTAESTWSESITSGGSRRSVSGRGDVDDQAALEQVGADGGGVDPLLEPDADHQPAAAGLAHALERLQPLAQVGAAARARRAAAPGRRRCRGRRARRRWRPGRRRRSSRGRRARARRRRPGAVMQAPIGKPPPSALALVITSGRTGVCS